MKELVEFLSEKGLIFKSIENIDPKSLGIRKRLQIHLGVDLKNYNTAIFQINQKSRFLTKDILKLEEMFNTLIQSKEIGCRKKILILTAPLCSKAKDNLKVEGWKLLYE